MPEETTPEAQALQVVEAPAALVLPRLNVAAIQQRVADINNLIDSLMVKGVHYGPAFPGAKEDSLLQPGAELMFMAFELPYDPETREEPLDGGHLRVVCEGAVFTPGGRVLGRITAECSTLEPKYRYRWRELTCPVCNQENIRRSRPRQNDPPGTEPGWYCWKKTGGCGSEFVYSDPKIANQTPGKIEVEDPAENWHTVRMMAQKRHAVALARRTFALSSRFVDEEAAQSAVFDVRKLAPVLRALPGEREEKWSRVVAYTLQHFGKAPKDLSALEGAVTMRWLGEQVDARAELRPEDFGYSPESENGAPPLPKKAKKAKAPEPDPTPEEEAQGAAGPPAEPQEPKAPTKKTAREKAIEAVQAASLSVDAAEEYVGKGRREWNLTDCADIEAWAAKGGKP